MNIDIMELPKNAEIWQILAKKLAYVRFLLYLCSVKGKTERKNNYGSSIATKSGF